MAIKQELPPLGYSFDALEPYIDAKTMEIHYTRHHQTYVDKLNLALEGYPELQRRHLTRLIKDISQVPEAIRLSVRNNGGGHLNHSLFWPLLKKGVDLGGAISEKIKSDLGGYDRFKELLTKEAMARFGSGWAWLVLNNGKLEVMSTPNQDNPIMDKMIPLLGIDVWEHAYYLKYQNRRNEYIEAFFNIINWDEVNRNLEKGLAK